MSTSTPSPSTGSGEAVDVFELHAEAGAAVATGTAAASGAGLYGFLAVVAGGLLFWGGSYLSQYGGRFDGTEFSEIPHGRPVAVIAGPVDPLEEVKAAGRKVYEKCANCHNDDGAGKPGIAPRLAGSDWVNAAGSARLIRLVLNGAAGPIVVSGEPFNAPGAAMNPWKDDLKDDEIAAVLTYVRSAWGNKAGPVAADEVKAVRDETKARTTPWTAEELLAVPLKGGGGGGGALTADQVKAHLKSMPADQLKALLQEVTPK